jgi:thiol:disulfide interchange protein
MKQLLLILLCISPLLSGELNWSHSYEQAVAKAKSENKNIFVFIEAKHCPYCEQMMEEVLSTKYIDNALKHFIPLKLDISSKDARTHFPKAVVTPTSYFITPQKQPLEEIIGYLNEEFFFWKIDAAEAEAKKIQKGEK